MSDQMLDQMLDRLHKPLVWRSKIKTLYSAQGRFPTMSAVLLKEIFWGQDPSFSIHKQSLHATFSQAAAPCLFINLKTGPL